MPVTDTQLAKISKHSLGIIEKKKPTDQVTHARPTLDWFRKNKKNRPPAAEIKKTIKNKTGGNLQWFYRDKLVTYNQRDPLGNARFSRRGCHSGFSLTEDEILDHGINVVEDGNHVKTIVPTDDELIRIHNLMETNMEDLTTGMEDDFSEHILLDGTQDVDAPAGLDLIVSLTPAVGTIGNLDASTEIYWRNHVALNLDPTPDTGDIGDKMEDVYYLAKKIARTAPDFFPCGRNFYNKYRDFVLKAKSAHVLMGEPGKPMKVDVSVDDNGVRFKGKPLVIDPTFEDLDAKYSPSVPWADRCYMLNSRHIKLEPITGQDMITRKPPRSHDQYRFYWGKTWRGFITTDMRNAHAVVALA